MDVLVLIRGGGSWESLQAFNSKEVVKAIFSSNIPVITGIGHEDDDTLADFTADLRASTPTHAAFLLSEPWRIADLQAKRIKKNISVSLLAALRNTKEKIGFYKKRLISAIDFLKERQESGILQLLRDLDRSKDQWLAAVRKGLLYEQEKLRLSSPRLKLKQGYSITSDDQGKVIKGISGLKVKQTMTTRFYKGQTLSVVKKIKK